MSAISVQPQYIAGHSLSGNHVKQIFVNSLKIENGLHSFVSCSLDYSKSYF